MKAVALLSFAALALSKDYQVPDLDYNNDEPTCENVLSLIDATSADITRLSNYVDGTLQERSSKLNDVYASVQKTCGIVQSKTPSLIQTTKLRTQNVKTLKKLSTQVKAIARSMKYDQESHKQAMSLIHLNMKSTGSNTLCEEVYETTIDLKNYLRFLGPAINEKYIDGILSRRIKNLKKFLNECTAAACEHGLGLLTEEETVEEYYLGLETEGESDQEETEPEEPNQVQPADPSPAESQPAEAQPAEEPKKDYSWINADEFRESFDGYEFYPTVDSEGGDLLVLDNYSVFKLMNWCDQTPDCKGFNSNGNIKAEIRPSSEWTQFTTDSSKGLFVKTQ